MTTAGLPGQTKTTGLPGQMQRLSTGNATLDRILGGGLPMYSVTLVAGEPGVGKTVLTLQLLFHLARQGKKCLYFSTLAEPALKLVRYTQEFSFFDADLFEHQIVFADLGSVTRAEGAEAALAAITSRVEREAPDLVVIDSFKAFHDLLGGAARSRAFIYDLVVHMASWGATTVLVGEYSTEEMARHPEFAIADGIVRLSNERQELSAVRLFEVLKLRGANYVTGRHFFEIGADGVTFFPRVRAPDEEGGPVSLAVRVPTGVPGLDALLDGGLPLTSSTIVEGGTGTGKTLLALQFLLEAGRQGQPSVLFTLEETPNQLRDIARAFGWDLAALEAAGHLSIHYTSPVELSTDRFLDQALHRVRAFGARRAVLDSLTSAALGVASERRFRELVYALTKHFRAAGVTLLMTQEVTEMLGSTQLTGHGVSSIADNVILLRYAEVEAHLERAISVLKARGVHHQTELRRLVVDDHGARVDGPFTHMRGVLTGLPQPLAGDPAGSAAGGAARRRVWSGDGSRRSAKRAGGGPAQPVGN